VSFSSYQMTNGLPFSRLWWHHGNDSRTTMLILDYILNLLHNEPEILKHYCGPDITFLLISGSIPSVLLSHTLHLMSLAPLRFGRCGGRLGPFLVSYSPCPVSCLSHNFKHIGAPQCTERFNSRNGHTANDSDSMNT